MRLDIVLLSIDTFSDRRHRRYSTSTEESSAGDEKHHRRKDKHRRRRDRFIYLQIFYINKVFYYLQASPKKSDDAKIERYVIGTALSLLRILSLDWNF